MADADGPAACLLVEAWSRAPLPPLRIAAQTAVERLLNAQEAAGLWPDAAPWRLTWRALALRTAAWAGIETSGLKPALARLVGGIKSFEDPSGALFRGERPAARDMERVAASALILQWLGEERSPEARTLLGALQRVHARDAPTPFALHLLAQVRFNMGGEEWTRHREEIADALLAGLAPDGGWRGAGSDSDARVRDTALTALSLTVCYRFPPASEWPRYAVARPPVSLTDWTRALAMSAYRAERVR